MDRILFHNIPQYIIIGVKICVASTGSIFAAISERNAAYLGIASRANCSCIWYSTQMRIYAIYRIGIKCVVFHSAMHSLRIICISTCYITARLCRNLTI